MDYLCRQATEGAAMLPFAKPIPRCAKLWLALAFMLAACACGPKAHAQAKQTSAPPAPASLFAWGETTHVADAGWGRMIHLHGVRWLCMDSLYPRPNSILQIQISTDNARTWTLVAAVAEPGRNLDNGNLALMPDNTLRLTCRSVVDENSRTAGAVRSYHLPVYQSKDGGKTWTFLSQVDTSEPPLQGLGQPSVGLWEPFLFLLPSGKVACAYANEKHARERPAFSQTVAERVSPDGGKTWGREITLAAQPGGGRQRPGMPVVARMVNGRYIAVYEIIGIGNGDVHYKTSPDGKTWAGGIGTPIAGQHQGPWVASLQSGRLLVTSCENQVSYSDDLGATWHLASSPPFPIGHNLSWPAIYQTGPDEVAVMTTWHGVNLRRGRILPLPRVPTASLQAMGYNSSKMMNKSGMWR